MTTWIAFSPTGRRIGTTFEASTRATALRRAARLFPDADLGGVREAPSKRDLLAPPDPSWRVKDELEAAR